MSHPGMCFICSESLRSGKETRLVKQKGIKTFISKSKARDDNNWEFLENLTEVEVHDLCRVHYCSSKILPSPKTVVPDVDSDFDFQSRCFLCTEKCYSSTPFRKVMTEQLRETINKFIDLREEWGRDVQKRIQSVSLVAVQARYHMLCYQKFKYAATERSTGRPKKTDHAESFSRVCQYMEESDDSQFTLKDLMDKMEADGFPLHSKNFKQMLINKHSSDILFVERAPKPTIVCFRNTGCKILMDTWYQKKCSNEAEERLRVISAAADIIREDIRSKFYETSVYSAPGEMLYNVVDDIPESLLMFLDQVLLKGKKNTEEKVTTKRDSIAHSIISVVRPRSFVSSIQLATGIFLTRKFGSRLMIDVLQSLGFCASYHNISLYEASAVMKAEKKLKEDAYIQHVYDNADHNVCTLDGFNTFHSMGGICCVTPKSSILPEESIPKLTRIPKVEQLASKINVPIVFCNRLNENSMGLKSITFTDVSQFDLGERETLPTSYALHILAKFLNIPHVPSWRGYMESITHNEEYRVSQIFCLPFVNLPPSDVTTINTVLHSAATECLRLNQKTSFVTFDQPLYIKAREIVANDRAVLTDVVVRLGGFHMLMSFLGAVGTIMDGSGLKKLLGIVYAGNTVDHMSTGHAFSRAIRGHLIVFTALGSVIARHANTINEQDQQHIATILADFAALPPTLQAIKEEAILIEIRGKLVKVMEELATVGRTSRLWLQYFHCINIVMQFIEAERLGNWSLHLQCVRDMLPIFHAAGHLSYAKSAQIYLQDMLRLPNIMAPEEYKKFTTEGHFTIRRSDKKWAGIWTDMTVEQTLMRVMKVSGGLTHGRGVNKEGVLARWILGMPIAYEVIDAFETFCGVRGSSGEQHTDWRPSSMKRDAEDYLKFAEWLNAHNPFSSIEGDQLVSIADGLCAGPDVNCDRAMELGKASMQTMVGVNAADVKLKRTTRVKSIATTRRGIVLNNEVVAVNTTLLFQRIAAVITDNNDLAKRALNHELAPFPPALFDEHGLMRKSAKAALYTSFKPQLQMKIDPSQWKIVIDGGFLLHRMIWPVGKTYGQILILYENFIRNNYGANAIVVFDGYKAANTGTKSYERLRRSKTTKRSQVLFEKDMSITVKQADSLSNDANKDRLIEFLTTHLTSTGIQVKQASEDADRLIVITAIEELKDHDKVAVAGQDVDLLVLLIALTPISNEIHFIKEGNKQGDYSLYSTKDNLSLQDTILVCHAFTGCDTTSFLFNRGKRAFLKNVTKDSALLDYLMVFNDACSTRERIKQAGEQLRLALYGAGKDNKTINNYRYERFLSSVARLKTEVRLTQLPLTSASTEEHSWRVYLQVQTWLGNDNLRPIDWGWDLKDGIYLPCMTKSPPAPDDILKMIHCTCKGSCTTRCGCRKAGLKCSSICSGCHGNSCCNSTDIDISSDTVPSSPSSQGESLVAEFDTAISREMERTDDFEFPEFTMPEVPLDDVHMTIDSDDDSADEAITNKRPRLD